MTEKEIILSELWTAHNYYEKREQIAQNIDEVIGSSIDLEPDSVKFIVKGNEFHSKEELEQYYSCAEEKAELQEIKATKIKIKWWHILLFAITTYLSFQLIVLGNSTGNIGLAVVGGLFVIASLTLLATILLTILQQYFEKKSKISNITQTIETKEKDYENIKSQLTSAVENFEAKAKESEIKYKNKKNELAKTESNLRSSLETLEDSFKLFLPTSIIPATYLMDGDTASKLLVIMLNKRADTVKELINIFETEKWRNLLLNTICDNVSILYEQNEQLLNQLALANENVKNLANIVNNLEFVSGGISVPI